MPYLLDTLHKVETTADAGAYLQRLDAFARGLDGETERLQRELEVEFQDLLSALPASTRREDAPFTDAARAILRRIVGKRFGKRPIVEAHILRL